jgi:hypothetical protein
MIMNPFIFSPAPFGDISWSKADQAKYYSFNGR